MNTIETLFVPYELAVKLKALGFDEPCLAGFIKFSSTATFELAFYKYRNVDFNKTSNVYASAPTFSQAFRWLYYKLDIEKGIMPLDTESQQLLLKELIDKVSSKHLLV